MVKSIFGKMIDFIWQKVNMSFSLFILSVPDVFSHQRKRRRSGNQRICFMILDDFSHFWVHLINIVKPEPCVLAQAQQVEWSRDPRILVTQSLGLSFQTFHGQRPNETGHYRTWRVTLPDIFLINEVWLFPPREYHAPCIHKIIVYRLAVILVGNRPCL